VSESLLKFCSRFDFDPVEYALSGGEDYTLLCTVAPESVEETAAKFQAEFKRPLFRIGEINDSNRLDLIYPDGSSKPIALTGWNHFKAG
jgi:thiamine-monophosphate kinase